MDNTSAPTLMHVDDTHVFEHLFKTHFRALHTYAYTIVREEMTAEEMVQNVFCKLWEKKQQITIQTSAKAYLYRAVYHECLNYLRHQKIKAAYQAYATQSMEHNDSAAHKVSLRELEEKIGTALNDLPEQCRTIFQMSRFEDLKYREIAEQLGLSIKTVENQMGKALRLMRLKLVDFLPAFLLLLLNL